MSAAEWIAKRREEHAHELRLHSLRLGGNQRLLRVAAYDALPKALDALEAVLAPHQLHEVPGGQRWCLHCGGDWPCPTVDAAETALRGDS